MIKKLLRNVFTTFILSLVLTIAVVSIYYTLTQKSKGYAYGDVIPLIISGAFFLNMILLLMAAPVIFLSYPHIYNNAGMRLLLYFAGPLLFIATVLSIKIGGADKTVYLITGIIFTLIHAWFYYKLVKKTD